MKNKFIYPFIIGDLPESSYHLKYHLSLILSKTFCCNIIFVIEKISERPLAGKKKNPKEILCLLVTLNNAYLYVSMHVGFNSVLMIDVEIESMCISDSEVLGKLFLIEIVGIAKFPY